MLVMLPRSWKVYKVSAHDPVSLAPDVEAHDVLVPSERFVLVLLRWVQQQVQLRRRQLAILLRKFEVSFYNARQKRFSWEDAKDFFN